MEFKINDTTVKVIKDDLTQLNVDAFVFYAQTDLSLGSGYGNAIVTRGGPSIKKELDEIKSAKMSESVVTNAGELNANYIIHAVGPAFQEESTGKKLRETIDNALSAADSKQVNTLAFPIMGSGFYGIAPEESIKIMYDSLNAHLSNNTKLKEVIICGNDNREYKLINNAIEKLKQGDR